MDGIRCWRECCAARRWRGGSRRPPVWLLGLAAGDVVCRPDDIVTGSLTWKTKRRKTLFYCSAAKTRLSRQIADPDAELILLVRLVNCPPLAAFTLARWLGCKADWLMPRPSNAIGRFARALLTSGSCPFPRLSRRIVCCCPEGISDPDSCWDAKALAPPPSHKGRGDRSHNVYIAQPAGNDTLVRGNPLRWCVNFD